jgi:molybdopterin-guanine dinucleotide biosynthesis protein A
MTVSNSFQIAGAIFAGGAARRFGSDKAAAPIGDTAMIDLVAERLRAQCAIVMVVGRVWPGLISVDDRPRPGLGPLGALAGALAYARVAGFATVLTSGCDLPDLPLDLARTLGDAPAVVRGQPLLGLWPTNLADDLADWVSDATDRSMNAWIERTGARRVSLPVAPANINRPEDLAEWIARRST